MKRLNLYMGLLKIMGLLLCIPFIGYLLTINKTVSMVRRLKAQEQLIYSIENKSNHSSEDNPVINDNEDVKSGAIIKILSKCMIGENIVIDSYTPILNYESNGFSVYTGELILSGGFNELTSLMEKLEKGKRGYRITSVQYETVNDFKTNDVKLKMTIIIQQASKI